MSDHDHTAPRGIDRGLAAATRHGPPGYCDGCDFADGHDAERCTACHAGNGVFPPGAAYRGTSPVGALMGKAFADETNEEIRDGLRAVRECHGCAAKDVEIARLTKALRDAVPTTAGEPADRTDR